MGVMDKEVERFYRNHRGGSGAVVLAAAFDLGTGEQRFGIFSELGLAQKWVDRLPDSFTTVYSPHIVDDPEWGNEAETR